MNGQNTKKHSVTLVDRGILSVTGVTDMVSFDDESVILEIDGSRLTVTGSGLCVTKLMLDCGEVSVTGSVDMIAYSEGARKGKSFADRLFGRE